MEVWIVYNESNYEGCSEPLAVFDNEAMADIFIAGSVATYATGMKKKQMGINEVLK